MFACAEKRKGQRTRYQLGAAVVRKEITINAQNTEHTHTKLHTDASTLAGSSLHTQTHTHIRVETQTHTHTHTRTQTNTNHYKISTVSVLGQTLRRAAFKSPKQLLPGEQKNALDCVEPVRAYCLLPAQRTKLLDSEVHRRPKKPISVLPYLIVCQMSISLFILDFRYLSFRPLFVARISLPKFGLLIRLVVHARQRIP